MAVKQNIESQEHHNHNHDEQKMSKYEEALSKYNTEIDDKAVSETVRKIIAEKHVCFAQVRRRDGGKFHQLF